MNTICLSEFANSKLKNSLKSRGYELIEIKKTDAVYDAISAHADIYLCMLYGELVIAPNQLLLIQDNLQRNKVQFSSGTSRLGYQYPWNIRYNAAQLGNFLIHNSKYTDPQILRKAKELGLQILHVNQGYTKCNLTIVDDHAAITSDAGISTVLKNQNIDVLMISQGHVTLQGFPYGFLGGASGKIESEIIFNGNLSAHPDYEKIKEFIENRGLQITYFEDYPLEDIGSIIQW